MWCTTSRHLAAVLWIPLLFPAAPAISRPQYLSSFHGFTTAGPVREIVLADLDSNAAADVVVLSSNAVSVHLGDGEGAFGTPLVLPPAAPTALAVGDLNGDGVQDIATTRGPGTLSVFHGNGDGTFDASIDFSVAGSPAGVAIGDLNEDGKADIVVTSQTTLQASILFGFMPTFYWPIVNLPTSSGPTRVRLRDLNADHHLDLVILNEDAANLQVQLGNGSGALGAVSTYTVGPSMTALEIGDVTEDGAVDLVASNELSGSLYVYPGNGDGTFAALTEIPAGATPQQVAIGDFDGNSIVDLVTASFKDNGFSLLLGLGGGAFAPWSHVSSEVGTIACAAGDVNRDGLADVLVGGSTSIGVHIGNGDGTFGVDPNTYSFAPGPKSVTVADLDNDGIPDLGVTSFDALSILFGRGDGTFENGPLFVYPSGTSPRAVEAADFDEDGWLDLAVAKWTPGELAIYRNAGSRSFVATETIPADYVYLVRSADLNHDGHVDLVANGYRELDVALGRGDGTFEPPVTYPTYNWGTRDMHLADLDLDGDTDVVFALSSSVEMIRMRLGNGDGTFGELQTVWQELNIVVRAVRADRMDGDSIPDLVMATEENNFTPGDWVSFASGAGDGTFAPRQQVGAGYAPRSIETADVNDDGFNDAIVSNSAPPGMVSLHLGNGDGTFGARLDFGIDGSAGFARPADLDRDGAMDLIVADLASPRIWVMINQRRTPTDAGERRSEILPQRSAIRDARELADGGVRIEYEIGTQAASGRIALDIFDVRGRLVRSLHPGIHVAGRNALVWDRVDTAGARSARGMYLVRLRTLEGASVRKLPLRRR